MKLMILHTNPHVIQQLQRLLDPDCHVLVKAMTEPSHLVEVTLSTKPEAILVGGNWEGPSIEDLEAMLRKWVIPVRWIRIPAEPVDQETWKDILAQLDSVHAKSPPKSPSPGKRIITFLPSRFCLPAEDENGHSLFTESVDPYGAMERFARLVTAGRRNHAQARRYFGLALKWMQLTSVEHAIAIAEAPEEAVKFGRATMERCLGALAHYVPGVDSEGLPSPDSDLSLGGSWSDEPSAECCYVLAAMLEIGYPPRVMELIRFALTANRLNNCSPFVVGLSVRGIISFLVGVIHAHCRVMDRLLGEGPLPSLSESDFRLFCKFWGLSGVINSPEILEKCLRASDYWASLAPPLPPFKKFQEGK